MATNPIYYASIRTGAQRIATANTNRDGTGTIATLYTGPVAPGARVLRIDAKAIAATTQGKIRIYVKRAGTWDLFKEIDVTAITPSATIDAWAGSVDLSLATGPGIFLMSTGDVTDLGVSTHNAETFNVTCLVGVY